MVTAEDIRKVAMALPRTSEHLIRDRVKFRVGSIVFVALSRDETTMGFGYPKTERDALVEAEPRKFFPPSKSDERFQWVQAWLVALNFDEMRELVQEAWRMTVPKSIAAQTIGPVIEMPSLENLSRAGHEFAALGNVNASWFKLLADTAPGLDLSNPDHRPLALAWLNSWGCRLPYRGTFNESAGLWASSTHLPSTPAIHKLTEKQIAILADAYGSLASMSIGKRSLGPTAAAKLLHALRPESVMPWDAAIAAHLYGSRDAAAFASHLRLGRKWAKGLIAETGFAPAQLAELAGRPGIPLSKVLDEYTYMLITRQ